MLIRCDKCSTLYELDESLLPPRGAPVQCSKCQFVFTAYPGARTEPPAASSDGETRAENAIQPGPSERSAMPIATSEPVATRPAPGPSPDSISPRDEGGATPGGLAPAASEPHFTADGRPIRKVPFPKEEPAPVGQYPGIGRAAGRANAVSGLPARRAPPWIVILAVALAIAIAVVAWRILGHRADPAAARPRAAGQSSLLRDERARLVQAVALLEPARLGDGPLHRAP